MKPFSLIDRYTRLEEIEKEKQTYKKYDIEFLNDYLNLNSINVDFTEDIFRIYNWDYLISDLRNNHFTLTRPSTWQDPFENFLLNSCGQLPDGRIVNFDQVRTAFYCSCWSLKRECDGLWRNYKKSSDCVVKAKTSTKKLFKSIYNLKNPDHVNSYFIGKVRYEGDFFIEDFFKRKFNPIIFQNGSEVPETMLLKRDSFQYEEEVRVIVKNIENTTELLQIPMDINSIFDELIIDPWIKPLEFENKKDQLKYLGFKGLINRSSLYDRRFFIAKITE